MTAAQAADLPRLYAPVVIVRCTAKMLSLLGAPKAELVEAPAADSDWYVNLLWIEGRKCLLFTHAGTLFSIFRADVLKGQLLPFGQYVVDTIRAALVDEGLPLDVFGPLAPAEIRLAKTASRHVLGNMKEIAFQVEWTLAHHGGLGVYDPDVLTKELQRSMRRIGDQYVDPIDVVHERFGP